MKNSKDNLWASTTSDHLVSKYFTIAVTFRKNVPSCVNLGYKKGDGFPLRPVPVRSALD